MFNNHIISFSGIDGCGKSTIINKISQSTSNHNFTIYWTRVGYTPFLNLLKKIARFISFNKLPSPGRSKLRTKALQNSKVQMVWITLSLLELIWIFTVKLRFISLFRTVLLDRQIDDSIVDLKVMFGDEIVNRLSVRLLIFILTSLSIRYIKIGLNVDLPTSDYRCSIKYEPFPDLPNDKEHRFILYDNLFKNNVFDLVLDSTEPPEVIVSYIMNKFFL